MLFSRAGIPAWMEILKLNMPKQKREKFFSVSQSLGYAEGILIALALGVLLDANTSSWKLLFMLSALLGIFSTALQGKLPIRGEQADLGKEPLPLDLLKPWRDAWHLLKTRPDFARFQWSYMAGGTGLMLMMPALAVYYADVLQLNHTDMALGRCLFMGLGFVLSSPCWAFAMERAPFSRLNSLILLGFCLFPLLIICASFGIGWFFFAFFLWGVAQGGSHLLWNLAGTVYAGNADSSSFTSVSILAVGLRGSIAPLLGGIFCDLVGPIPVLMLGAFSCAYGAWHLLIAQRLLKSLSG